MQVHSVFYRVYPGNPNAADAIIAEATKWLKEAPGVESFWAGKVINTGRAVGNAQYDVMLLVIFADADGYQTYMKAEPHMEFVKFVLCGYMLKGSTAKNPAKEFIEYVLRGETPREWERDPAVPDTEVVWGGEVVFDAVA